MLRFLFFGLIGFLFFIFSGNSYAQERTFSDQHIYPVLKKGTDLHSGITFLSGALASWGTRQYDDEYRNNWINHQQISKNDAYFGDLIGTGAASLLVMGTQYLAEDDPSNFHSHARGFLYGGLAIYTLKTAFGRNRPGNSHNHQSFPSGHTAITFMTATHLTYAYGWKAALIAYPIAAYTGLSRLADDAHWLSDIVGGAFLGYFVGRATYYDSQTLEDQFAKNSFRYDFIPVIHFENYGVQLSLSY